MTEAFANKDRLIIAQKNAIEDLRLERDELLKQLKRLGKGILVENNNGTSFSKEDSRRRSPSPSQPSRTDYKMPAWSISDGCLSDKLLIRGAGYVGGGPDYTRAALHNNPHERHHRLSQSVNHHPYERYLDVPNAVRNGLHVNGRSKSPQPPAKSPQAPRRATSAYSVGPRQAARSVSVNAVNGPTLCNGIEGGVMIESPSMEIRKPNSGYHNDPLRYRPASPNSQRHLGQPQPQRSADNNYNSSAQSSDLQKYNRSMSHETAAEVIQYRYRQYTLNKSFQRLRKGSNSHSNEGRLKQRITASTSGEVKPSADNGKDCAWSDVTVNSNESHAIVTPDIDDIPVLIATVAEERQDKDKLGVKVTGSSRTPNSSPLLTVKHQQSQESAPQPALTGMKKWQRVKAKGQDSQPLRQSKKSKSSNHSSGSAASSGGSQTPPQAPEVDIPSAQFERLLDESGSIRSSEGDSFSSSGGEVHNAQLLGATVTVGGGVSPYDNIDRERRDQVGRQSSNHQRIPPPPSTSPPPLPPHPHRPLRNESSSTSEPLPNHHHHHHGSFPVGDVSGSSKAHMITHAAMVHHRPPIHSRSLSPEMPTRQAPPLPPQASHQPVPRSRSCITGKESAAEGRDEMHRGLGPGRSRMGLESVTCVVCRERGAVCAACQSSEDSSSVTSNGSSASYHQHNMLSDSRLLNVKVSNSQGSRGEAWRGATEKERKRQYRIGLNLFNRKPHKGIRYLMEQRFLENSSLYVARFLLTRKGLSKQMIGEYLGDLQSAFSQNVLECVVQEMDFTDLEIDVALRKFLSYFRLPGEAQKIEKIVEVFSGRYCLCNPAEAHQFNTPDTVFLLSFAIIMLNTDLHNPNIKGDQKMKLEGFLKNLKGIDAGKDVSGDLLGGIYDRILKDPLRPGMDHTTQVRKVEETILGKAPILSVPHRRLVCYCRLYEVNDPAKKEKVGLHQREVFLFNDVMVITKIFNKKKNAITYTYRQALDLSDMVALSFESDSYQHGIRLLSRTDVRPLMHLNARNQHDREKFLDDLKESIAEMAEMEKLKNEEEKEKATQRQSNSLHASRNRESKDSGVVDIDLSPVSQYSHHHHHTEHHRHGHQHGCTGVMPCFPAGSGSHLGPPAPPAHHFTASLPDLQEDVKKRHSSGSVDSGMVSTSTGSTTGQESPNLRQNRGQGPAPSGDSTPTATLEQPRTEGGSVTPTTSAQELYVERADHWDAENDKHEISKPGFINPQKGGSRFNRAGPPEVKTSKEITSLMVSPPRLPAAPLARGAVGGNSKWSHQQKVAGIYKHPRSSIHYCGDALAAAAGVVSPTLKESQKN